MSCLIASVACLARRVEGATSRSSALLADVAQFAASITLHGLRLAVTSEMIGPTAFVACGRAACLETAAAKATLESTSTNGSTTTNTDSSRALAVALSCVSRLLGIALVFKLTAK